MISEQITIINKLGLHARAAAKLVQLSNQFHAKVLLEKNGEEADGKSIMDVLMLAGTKGSVITISADGQDEDTALKEICILIENKFGEEE